MQLSPCPSPCARVVKVEADHRVRLLSVVVQRTVRAFRYREDEIVKARAGVHHGQLRGGSPVRAPAARIRDVDHRSGGGHACISPEGRL